MALFPNDDDLHNLDLRYYGPKGKTFPGWRYVSYAVWLIVTPVVLWVLVAVHLGVGFLALIAAVSIGTAATYAIVQHVDRERPLWTILVSLWQDTGAPRVGVPLVETVRLRHRRYARKGA